MNLTYCNAQPQRPWRQEAHKSFKVFSAGIIRNFDKIINVLEKNPESFDELQEILHTEYQNFGLIVEGPNFCVAICDRIQSYPLFYDENALKVSTRAQDLAADSIDSDSTLEFSMAGYTFGNRTFYKNIQQLMAGEILHIQSNNLSVNQYFTYAPKPELQDLDEVKLNSVIDEAIERMLQTCKGKSIVVPLSGGLDSRLILAKLCEHGAKNLYSFSYGLKNNFEARMAQKIARRLNVPWKMIESKPSRARELFNTAERKSYEDFSHGYSRVPHYVEYEAIYSLRKSGYVPESAVIVNGQAGDYISGGHIPSILYDNNEPSQEDMISYIFQKHCSLWENLKTPENKQKIVKTIADLLIPKRDDISQKDNLIRQYESFEWQERQCKMVVHGQRTYEYFGYDWRLPLWDKALIEFFERAPWDQKYQQSLFKSYVKSYNYEGVFDEMSAIPRPWQRHQFWILYIGRMLSLLRLQEQKKLFYKRMSYKGDQYFQYALFGPKAYNRHYKDLRNMVSLAVRDFMECNNIDFPKP